MTTALFSEDAYLRSCHATVNAVADDHFVADQTVFYPLGGGQPGDTGTVSIPGGPAYPIVDTRRLPDGNIAHFVDNTARLEAGVEVELSLDWERRYGHMRMHTCLHLLGSLLQFPVTGGNISLAKSRLDFDMSDPVDKVELTQQLNALIEADHPLSTQWITDEELQAQPDLVRTMSVKPPLGSGRVRLLEIEGIDLQPCGGTHVRRCGEIGPVLISKVEKKGRQNRRVNVVFNTDP